MIRIYWVVLLLLWISSEVNAGDSDQKLVVVFYNVENLFDTIDQPKYADEEFTPESEKQWNTEKYQQKLEDLSKVLNDIGERELPEIIGLAEVENKKVLTDLINTKRLKEGNYGIVHEESPDTRGIDVALLYRKDAFEYLDHQALTVHIPSDSIETTRDILYVKGKADDGKNLHIFVNHWSSRRGGMKETEPKRFIAAASLRQKVDLLLARESDPRIIIMGDFNDEPTNRSVTEILRASNKRKNVAIGDLYNLHYDMHNLEDVGTYNYRGTWNMLDQIIISYNLINKQGQYSTDYAGGKIFKADYLIYETEEGPMVPGRTYGGPNYYGGISDHFPVFVVFTLSK